MNLNNDWELKKALEDRIRKDNPKYAEQNIAERNLFSWWRIKRSCGKTVMTFFGNEYDNDSNCLKLKIDTMRNTPFYGITFHGTRYYR